MGFDKFERKTVESMFIKDAETALKKFSAVRVLADVFPVTYAMTEKAEVNKKYYCLANITPQLFLVVRYSGRRRIYLLRSLSHRQQGERGTNDRGKMTYFGESYNGFPFFLTDVQG